MGEGKAHQPELNLDHGLCYFTSPGFLRTLWMLSLLELWVRLELMEDKVGGVTDGLQEVFGEMTGVIQVAEGVGLFSEAPSDGEVVASDFLSVPVWQSRAAEPLAEGQEPGPCSPQGCWWCYPCREMPGLQT